MNTDQDQESPSSKRIKLGKIDGRIIVYYSSILVILLIVVSRRHVMRHNWQLHLPPHQTKIFWITDFQQELVRPVMSWIVCQKRYGKTFFSHSRPQDFRPCYMRVSSTVYVHQERSLNVFHNEGIILGIEGHGNFVFRSLV